jgi:hypothetical protein
MSIINQVLKSAGKERRTVGRTRINRNASLFFAGQTGVFSCNVRDVTNQGAGIRLEGSTFCRSTSICRSTIFRRSENAASFGETVTSSGPRSDRAGLT